MEEISESGQRCRVESIGMAGLMRLLSCSLFSIDRAASLLRRNAPGVSVGGGSDMWDWTSDADPFTTGGWLPLLPPTH